MSENENSIGKMLQDGTVSGLTKRFGKDGAWKVYDMFCKEKINKLLEVFDICDMVWCIMEKTRLQVPKTDGKEEFSIEQWSTKIYEVLDPFLNLTPGDKILYITWLLAYMSGVVRLPILVIDGPEGCGKSTLCKITHAIVNTDYFCSFYPREKQPYEPVLLTGQEGGKEMFDSILRRELTIYEKVTELNDDQISGMTLNTSFQLPQEVALQQRGVILQSSGLVLPDDMRDYCIRLEMPPLKETIPQEDIMADLEQKQLDIYKAATALCMRLAIYYHELPKLRVMIETETEKSKILADYLLTGVCLAFVVGNVREFLEQFQKQ